MLPRFKKLILLPLGLIICTITACSGLRALDLITPSSGYTVHKNIAYGSLPRQFLDVYAPDKPVVTHDVVLFFYGGSWQDGTKNFYRFVAQALASRGYMVVIADYRLYPQVYFPDFIHDGATALYWTHQHAAAYGGNPKRLFLAGHSAGAHIAMMLALNDSYIQKAGGQPDWIHGTMGIAGPYDFLPFTDPKIKAVFSHVPDKDTQPINFVTSGPAPILLLHGDKDKDVYLRNSDHLAAKLRDQGNNVDYHVYPGVNHIDIVLGIAHGFEKRAPTLQDMLTFMQSY